jgi:hypothetical protein
LLVDDAEALRAQALIAAYNAAQPLAAEEPDSFPGSLLC